MTGAWCKACKQPVRLAGPAHLPPELQRAVQAESGEETGPGHGEDGTHVAMPTDENPVLRAVADNVERKFPMFRVSARFGILRATWRPEFLPPGAPDVPYTAGSGPELEMKLGAALKLSGAVLP